MSDEELPEAVQLHNDMHAYVNGLQRQLYLVFADLIHTKICKADNTLTAKCCELLPKLPNGPAIRVVHKPDKSVLQFMVTMTASRQKNDYRPARYLDHLVYIGKLELGSLVEVTWAWPLPQYDLATVRQARLRVRELTVALRRAKEDCGPFSEY